MILGITGTNGAGKGTVVDYLVKQKGFTHYSARDFIVEEIKRRGMPINRDTTRLVANDLRRQYGAGHILQELLGRAEKVGGHAVLESIRNVGEADALREKGVVLWAVDADRSIRYERSILRGTDLDKITFEKFCEQEDREMASTESYDMNVFAVMKKVNATLTNNGTPEELYQQVEVALAGKGATVER